MKNTYIASLIASVWAMGVFAGSALADGNVTCTTELQEKWKPKEEAEKDAKARGFRVAKIVITNGCYEVYGIKDGGMFELFYDPMGPTLRAAVKK